MRLVSALLAALATLTGCDQQRIARLEEGVATEEDVRALRRQDAWDRRSMQPPNTSMLFIVCFERDLRVVSTSTGPDPQAPGQRGI